MCEQLNCLFECQIAQGYTTHHWMAILHLGRNDKTSSTVTLTTFWDCPNTIATLQRSEGIIRDWLTLVCFYWLLHDQWPLIYWFLAIYVCKIQKVLRVFVCVYKCLWAHAEMRRTFTLGVWARHRQKEADTYGLKKKKIELHIETYTCTQHHYSNLTSMTFYPGGKCAGVKQVTQLLL